MTAWVWKVPGADRPATIVACADDVELARARLNGALDDLPECLNAAAIAAWVNVQPPARQSRSDDLDLAISADLYV
ncbi:MAG TPA: hypothetical protein VFA04_11425 [Bryobacteraceae bacterium]|nr:hypothetical protein [Bryobacteraceae bacterium]